jgi:hypothetical protein
MQLPFTHDQFLDVFGRYNGALWPLALILWLATAVVLALVAWGRPASRAVAALLGVHWLVSGAVYHLIYFRPINPAATLFGALFVLEAALVVWFGAVRSRLTFAMGRAPRHVLAVLFCLYGLAYPGIALLSGFDWPRLPLFAVPCPTTLLTAGLLLMVPPRQLRGLAVIPILWSLVGGSAALTLGVRPDLVLFLAAALLLIHIVAPRFLDARRAA